VAKSKEITEIVFPCEIVIDDREKRPYEFEDLVSDKKYGSKPIKVNKVIRRIETGDYTLVGHESKISIERKNLSDLYSTIGHGRERFEAEFQRLNELDHAFLVVESDWSEVLNPPESITRHTDLPPKTISRTAISWQLRYPRVHWFPCGSREIAEATTFRILEMYLRTQLKGSE
jgi:DNA excision repair protein ERCC-4